MAYKRPATVYELTFPEFEELIVRAKALTTGQMMKLMRHTANASVTKGGTRSPESIESIDQMFTMFAKALVSWELEDEDGNPIPATLEGIESQDFDFVLRIIEAWTEAVSGVSEDLGKDSPSGPLFPEGSIPMTALPSLSLTS